MDYYIVTDLLREIKEVLEDTNIRGLLNYFWLMVRRSNQNNIRFYNVKFYQQFNYKTLNVKNDKNLLIFILRMNDLANTQAPARIYKYYKNQIVSPFTLIWTYTKDNLYIKQVKNQQQQYVRRQQYYKQQDYISYTSLVNLKQRANQNIILDYAETSTPLLPSFYVLKNGDTLQIVIRGTNNSYDASSDIYVDLIKHNQFQFHRGFYVHATGILEILESNMLINSHYKYEITGHSMGGGISAILGYLLGDQVGFNNVKSFGAGMACCGDINFSQFSKKFHYTIVNRADIVPSASIHCLRTQIIRLMGKQNTQIKQQSVLDTNIFGQTNKKQQNYAKNEKIYVKIQSKKEEKQHYQNMSTKQLSQETMQHDDLYPAGNIYHFINDQLYQIDIHDIGEAYIDYLSFLDHFGYWKISEWIQTKLQEYQKQNQSH